MLNFKSSPEEWRGSKGASNEGSGVPEGLSRQVEELDVGHKHLQGVMSDHNEDFQAAVEALKLEIEEINSKLNLTMRALGNSPAGPELGKKKIPEPRAYEGARDARD